MAESKLHSAANYTQLTNRPLPIICYEPQRSKYNTVLIQGNVKQADDYHLSAATICYELTMNSVTLPKMSWGYAATRDYVLPAFPIATVKLNYNKNLG